MIDSRLLKKRQDFKELTDTYIIFICQHDKFRQKKPIYHVDKIIRETGEIFDDGAHIIYVNGKYRGDDAFGKLAHDFNCKKSQNMHYKPFADGVKHFKETEKGRKVMCELVEKYAETVKIEDKIDTAKKLMSNTNWSLDQTLDNMGVSDKERELIIHQLKK